MAKKFEAAVYNQQVRDAIQQLEKHPNYSNDWADLHFIEIKANDKTLARKMIEEKYPKAKGFVIDGIHEVPEFD
jgi:hypothetical protein